MKHLGAFLALLFALQVYTQPTIDWYRTYDDEQHYYDGSTCCTIDDEGNVYVSGEAFAYYGFSRSSEYDIVTIKYSASGEQQWVRKYHYYNYDGAVKMYYYNNSIYVLGWSQDSNYNMGGVILKYNNSGNLEWCRRIDGLSNGKYQPVDMNFDQTFENFYLSGYYYNNNNDSAFGVIHKINSNGNLVWEKIFRYENYDITHFLKSQIDNQGNIICCGFANFNYPNYGFRALLLKLDYGGNILWIKSDSLRFAWDVACNSQNEIFTAGIRSLPDDHRELNITKYTSFGNEVWNDLKNGPYGQLITYNFFPVLKYIDVDNQQDIIVTFSCETGFQQNSLCVYKFDNSGNEIWQYTETLFPFTKPNNLFIDNLNNIYVNSTLNYFDTNKISLIKLSPDGNLIWKAGKIPGTNYNIDPFGLTVKNSTIVVSGYSDGFFSNSDYITIKYTQTIGIKPILSEIPGRFSLSQNFPNPFNPTTKIRFAIPPSPNGVRQEVRFAIYDILGREVAALVNERLSPGTYEVEFDGTNAPSGVYFYKLVSDSYTETKKMILLK